MQRVLIANRGEIAVRIIRACRDAGYHAIAVASEADQDAMHARMADETHLLPGHLPLDTYLNQEAVLRAAELAKADAIHPGYGLLSENEFFAAAVEAAGLTWIGPPPHAIGALGDKVNARALARKVGAPLLPSRDAGALTLAEAQAFVAEFGLPVIIKAQNGGGGRGMRIVRSAADLAASLAAAEREAGLAFGRPDCFIERYAERARHVETQCLADRYGNVTVLSTRDCTLQRRQQKVIEEAPAPFLSEAQDAMLVAISVSLLQEAGYRGAATCEFLVIPEGEIFFLEVNTRVQVEHPVTEEVTGLDIIREMFRIAEGEQVCAAPERLVGHAIEFRINAEDPWADFRPTPGRIDGLRLPGGPGVRVDFGYAAGDTIPPFYDSLMGKLIVTGRDRREALARARRALAELNIRGVSTIVPLHRAMLDRGEFAAADAAGFSVHTRWIDEEMDRLAQAATAYAEQPRAEDRGTKPEKSADRSAAGQDDPPTYRQGVKAPLSGLILELCVTVGDMIAPGDAVAIMESMKMEQTVVAEVSGVVARINVEKGGFIDMDADILGVD